MIKYCICVFNFPQECGPITLSIVDTFDGQVVKVIEVDNLRISPIKCQYKYETINTGILQHHITMVRDSWDDITKAEKTPIIGKVSALDLCNFMGIDNKYKDIKYPSSVLSKVVSIDSIQHYIDGDNSRLVYKVTKEAIINKCIGREYRYDPKSDYFYRDMQKLGIHTLKLRGDNLDKMKQNKWHYAAKIIAQHYGYKVLNIITF